MTDWLRLAGGGFAFMSAPFAVHPLDKRRAVAFREEAKMAGLDWPAVAGHVDAWAEREGWSDTKRAEEMARVQKFMKGHLRDGG